MTRHWRIFFGSIGMMIYIALYAFLAAGLMSLWEERPSTLVELALYVILGVAWIFPLKPVFKWMGRGAHER